jgi:hypothetical protein
MCPHFHPHSPPSKLPDVLFSYHIPCSFLYPGTFFYLAERARRRRQLSSARHLPREAVTECLLRLSGAMQGQPGLIEYGICIIA